jgi:hypothetical protein
VIAIATAQYQPLDAETIPSSSVLSGCKYLHIITFTLGSLILHVSDESDERSYDSDEDEDNYSYEQEINFTDLAARPSAIRTEVSASQMLQLAQGVLLEADGKSVFCNPLQKAVHEDDLEAFVRTLELYQFAGMALWPNAAVHDLAVMLDRPDMVDELTRRTGVGIPYYPSDTAENPHQKALKKAKEGGHVYLGLKVGGKRRAETIQQASKAMMYNCDLLRNAIGHGSSKVVEYLAGPRPLAAYRYYAATHSGDISQYLKSIENLEAVLPDLLGWHVDELNESPLLCAVMNNKLDILKQLFTLKPNLMEEALHKRYGSSWLFLRHGCADYGAERSLSVSTRCWPLRVIAPARKL